MVEKFSSQNSDPRQVQFDLDKFRENELTAVVIDRKLKPFYTIIKHQFDCVQIWYRVLSRDRRYATLQMFEVKGQRSRSQCKVMYQQKKMLKYGNG